MATTDIGYLLFVEALGMVEYPGAPFTGNIFRDIIMFLIVPTIFIIMVLYIATGRIIPDRKMRIMLGVGAYLFIIASGFYRVFALLSGPYFIFLIFVLGIVGFLAGHFRRGGHAGDDYSGGGHYSGGRSAHYAVDDKPVRGLLSMPTLNPAERRHLQEELIKIDNRITQQERLQKAIESGTGRGDLGRIAEILDKLIAERDAIEQKLQGRAVRR